MYKYGLFIIMSAEEIEGILKDESKLDDIVKAAFESVDTDLY